MSTNDHLTEEEARDEYVKGLGEPLGKLFYALKQDVIWLHAEWGEYLELFGTKASRVELLNKAAPFYFRVAQDTLRDAVLLHIARLTDPDESVRRSNLTVQRLPSLVDGSIKSAVSDLVETAKQKASFCRDWRNRRIAHSDLALALKEGARPLDAASRAGVRDAIDAIDNVLKEVIRHYLASDEMFDPLKSWGGAEDLLYVIDDGLKAAEARQARLSSGGGLPEDWGPRGL